jgi:D-alanyl-D-alanine carboxypeptidase
MADDPAHGDAAPASNDDAPNQDDAPDFAALRAELAADQHRPWPPVAAAGARSSTRRTLALCLAFAAPAAVIALGVFSIVRGGAPRGPAPIASAVPSPTDAGASAAAVQTSAGSLPPLEKLAPAGLSFEDEGSDEEPVPAKRVAPKHFATVEQAAAGSCSTESVDGLSRQIIEQARCIKPNDFVALPKRANLVLAAHVFPFLELGARDHLLRALAAHSAATMTINSALRTVAQQYLVSHWAASKICGVQLATPPGESNHEIGTALDVAEAAKWRTALEAEDFRWLGTSDRVHFDYKGGNSPRSATDVLAFQRLWNRNHPADTITEGGQYNPATEQRLKAAPPNGFAIGPSCRNVGLRKR